MKSFVSRGLVKHTYNWRYNYYYLKDEGIEYLREYLHIPEGVVPETLTKAAAKPARAPNSGYSQREGREGDYEGRRGGDFKRGGYRRGVMVVSAVEDATVNKCSYPSLALAP